MPLAATRLMDYARRGALLAVLAGGAVIVAMPLAGAQEPADNPCVVITPSPTARPVLWDDTAPESPPNPKVESIVDPSEQPARRAASGKAKNGATRKSGMKVP